MRSLSKRVLALAAASVALAGTTATTAGAATAESARVAPASVQAGNITTWIEGNVRYGPSTSYKVPYTVSANQRLMGVCWLKGGWVDANGIEHNKWVRLSDGNYIWGGLLRGNETGGISRTC